MFAASVALAASPAAARNASAMRDLVGARASSGESALQSRGYTFIDGSVGKYGARDSYYWNGRDDSCLHVETYDGRYTSISDASKSDCHHGGGGAGAAAGVALGAVLLGALLSHKKHNHDDNQHNASADYEAQYERGFSDGLHNVSYHNYDRSDAYSDGYSSGVEQREANTSYHHGSGGYRQVAQISDLNGARASSADSTLSQRGFRNVDGFKSGNTAYTIWNRPQSNQCVQMTVADGRVYDIRDIGRHPNCR